MTKNTNQHRCLMILSLLFCLILSVPTIAQERDRLEENNQAFFDLPWSPDKIEGVWNARVNIAVCNGPNLFSFDSMGLFGSNGAFHDTNSTNPALRSATFGYWRHVRGRQYRFAFRFFRFDAAGTFLGTQVVRHDVTLSRDGKSYNSSGTAETYDAEGVQIGAGCSNSTATRFQ